MDVAGQQTDLFGSPLPPLAADRPAALARQPLETHVSLTEALRRVGEVYAASRPTLYKMGVAAFLSRAREAKGYARTPSGGLRPCLYRVPLSAVEDVIRRLEAGETFIPPDPQST